MLGTWAQFPGPTLSSQLSVTSVPGHLMPSSGFWVLGMHLGAVALMYIKRTNTHILFYFFETKFLHMTSSVLYTRLASNSDLPAPASLVLEIKGMHHRRPGLAFFL